MSDSRTITKLRSEVARLATAVLRKEGGELADAVTNGNLEDWGDYRFQVGRLSGFRRAIAVMAEADAKLLKDDEDIEG